jgi:peptide/nickel transport system permease protein
MIRASRFLSRRQNLAALVIVTFFLLTAMAAPWISPPDDPEDPSPFRKDGRSSNPLPRPPSNAAPLGTTPGQFDIYHTLVWGTRSALRFGLVIALSASILGVLIGAISGYYGGWIGGLTMRITDAFITFPAIAGVWLLQQVMRPASVYDPPTWLQRTLLSLKLEPVMLTLILLSWMPYARIIHVQVSQLKGSEYILAARSVGAGNRRIIMRHLLPNALAPAVVMAARDVGGMVILGAAFTFIGIGSSTEWGQLLVIGRDYVIGMRGNPLAYWWTFLPATLALILFGLGWNLLGDGLNELLDPKSAR